MNKGIVEESKLELEAMKDDEKLRMLNNNNLTTFDVKLTVTYDMGWNKQSSGHRYDSTSGHGLLIGARSKKVLNFVTLSKQCRFCQYYKEKLGQKEGEKVPEHECTFNHEGTSKSMECCGLLEIIEQNWDEQRMQVGIIVCDNDSTMQRVMRHDYRKLVKDGIMKKEEIPTNENGKELKSGNLPVEIPEPTFLADFNHRVKSVGKVLYELASKSKKNFDYG